MGSTELERKQEEFPVFPDHVESDCRTSNVEC